MGKNNRSSILLKVVSLIGIGLVFSSRLSAHSAILWAEVNAGRVLVEAYFSNGNKVRDGRIVVLDANDQQLLEGKTNHQGRFEIPLPSTRDMTIVLMIGGAHRAEFELTEEDMMEHSGRKQPIDTEP